MPNRWNWARDSRIHYVFPGTAFTTEPTLSLTWYDGALRPPADICVLLEGDDLPQSGSIFIGMHGVMVLPHINRPLLYPDRKFKDFNYPEVVSADHWAEFVGACTGRASTSAPFDYAGPLTETVLLGCVAVQFPLTTLHWNPKKLEFDLAEANRLVRRDYRPGWGTKGLGWTV